MTKSKNLDDIPAQFKKYANNMNYKTFEKKPNQTINAMSNISEKNFQTTNQKNNCSMNMQDKLFVFIILMIFFDNC